MSRFFIGRPIVAIVIAILMVIAGVVSVLSLPTAQFPDIVPPEILVPMRRRWNNRFLLRLSNKSTVWTT